MMRTLLVTIGVLAVAYLGGQDLPNRYLEPIFTQVDETSQVLFSSQVPQPRPGGGFYEWLTGYPLNADESDLQNVDLYMDIFEPSGDTLDQRPLIILCFGGGFLSGSKDHWSIRLLAQELAKRGFVTATMDYRLGMNIFDRFLAMRAVYRGVQDGRSAVRFFRRMQTMPIPIV
jgi:acetyl esterase/lipase